MCMVAVPIIRGKQVVHAMVAAGQVSREGGAVSWLYHVAISPGVAAWQRPPVSDYPRAQSRLSIVRNAREQLTQLDGSREFATPPVGSADSGSLRLGDDEHRQSMEYADSCVQSFVAS